jgi:AraC family L-rhamnose operon transcriptional activator RhaR
MINFCFKRKDKVPIVRLLNRSEISRIRHCLAAMARSHSSGALDCDGSVQVINMLLIAMRAGSWLKPLSPAPSQGNGRVVDQLLSKMDLGDPLKGTVKQSGYGRDHLNRILKREVGLTLGQVRAKRRLELAERLLEQGMQVGAVAQEVGLPDSSYFTRWFRRQTGIVPTKWVSRKPGSMVVDVKG